MSLRKLTTKQETFCIEVVKGGTVANAYRIAYDAEGMADRTIRERSSELLALPNVFARVTELRERIAEKAVIQESRILEEVARIALLDPAKFFDEKGTLLSIHKMAIEARVAISSIDIEEQEHDGVVVSRVKKIRLWDKNQALDKLMKHLGSYEKDNKQKGVFDNVPAETLRMIEDKLRGLTKPGLAGDAESSVESRFTH